MYTRLRQTLPARNPRFRHFLAASTVSLVGSNVFDIAIPLYVLQRSGSVIDLSLASMMLVLPQFFMAPLTGYFSDHRQKRLSLLAADVGQVACLLALSLYALWGGTALWPILVCVFLTKTLMLTFETISQFQLIPALVGPADLTSGNTWFLSLHRVIQIAGPLIGGVLMHFSGVQSCIWVNILSFVATLHFTYRFTRLDQLLSPDKPVRTTSHPAAVVVEQFRDSLRFIWRSPIFHPFILLMFLWNLSSLTLNSPSLTYYFTVTHQFSSAQYGLIISSFGILGIFGFMVSPALYKRIPFANVFLGSALFQAFFATLCVLPLGLPILMGGLFGVSRAGSSVLSMGNYFIRQTRVPRAQNGAINSTLRMFFMSAAPLSSLLQGWMIDRFGVGTSLVFGAVCLWGTWYYSRSLARAYREEEALLQPYPEMPTRRRA